MFSHSTWKCNRGHVASIITTNVQNDASLHGRYRLHLSIASLTVCCTLDQTIYAAAAVVLSMFQKLFKVVLFCLLLQILLPICYLQNPGSPRHSPGLVVVVVAPKSLNLYIFFKIKCDSLCTDPFSWLALFAVECCTENKVSWYHVSPKLVNYSNEIEDSS